LLAQPPVPAKDAVETEQHEVRKIKRRTEIRSGAACTWSVEKLLENYDRKSS
jgi:hypothetical protein